MDNNHHEHTDMHIHPTETPAEYIKFALIIFGIIAVSITLTIWRGGEVPEFLGDFMGVFFLVFGFFKLVNLKMFAITYSGYDIIARRVVAWGYAFPFVEIGLGGAYLITRGQTILNILTIVITVLASVGVFQELTKKSNIMCACLGTVIRLPLSKISLVEDVAMGVMAAAMLGL